MPLTVSSSAASDQAVSPVSWRGAVLVVDDEPAIRSLTARLLRRGGVEVLEARDGDEAVRRLGECSAICMVLLDWRMPGRCGAELLETLRRGRPELRVVVTSGDPPSLELDEHTGFLNKPFCYDMLRGAVAAALRDEPLPAYLRQ